MPPSPLTVAIDGLKLTLTAEPLEGAAFAPFGKVVQNPNPGLNVLDASRRFLNLPFGGGFANQGTAVKYQQVSPVTNLYDQAPSRQVGNAAMSMFVCAARELETGLPAKPQDSTFRVTVLERHPFTTQTFVPLTADPAGRYLVIVAPSLPPTAADEGFPVPATTNEQGTPLPGRGLPDVAHLRAFIATIEQAVTYGAGTWHAPMVALGERGSAVTFVVTQFANQVAIEDCQEVFFASSTSGSIAVSIPAGRIVSKL